MVINEAWLVVDHCRIHEARYSSLLAARSEWRECRYNIPLQPTDWYHSEKRFNVQDRRGSMFFVFNLQSRPAKQMITTSSDSAGFSPDLGTMSVEEFRRLTAHLNQLKLTCQIPAVQARSPPRIYIMPHCVGSAVCQAKRAYSFSHLLVCHRGK